MAQLLLGDFELVDCLSVECQCNIKGKERFVPGDKWISQTE